VVEYIYLADANIEEIGLCIHYEIAVKIIDLSTDKIKKAGGFYLIPNPGRMSIL
jgi:hypothetical protein